jgi:hypothetical protein
MSGSAAETTPTLAGFQAFVTNAVQIPASVLPANSPYFGYAYNVAISIVSKQLLLVDPGIYVLAVYNLAANNLVNYAQDAPGAPPYGKMAGTNGDIEALPYFAYMRKKFGIVGFVPGVISSSSDQGTSQSTEVLEGFKTMTLLDLNATHTPWGQTYLAFASQIGSLWGAS